MNRRQFLGFGGMTLAGAGLGVSLNANANSVLSPAGASFGIQQCLLSSFQRDGRHFLASHDLLSGKANELETRFQGHAVLAHPEKPHHVVVFGDRSEVEACEVDFSTAKQRNFKTADVRYFNGHGCYSTDGKLLYTTENAFGYGAKGVIGIRDAEDTLDHLGEFDSYGLEPHDIQLMPGGKQLVVANSGVFEQDARYGMGASLVFIDSETGDLQEEHRLENNAVSFRHLVVSSGGSVGVSLQHQASVVAWKEPGKPLELMSITPQNLEQLGGAAEYMALAEAHSLLVTTSPVASQISLWDVKNRKHIKNIALKNPQDVIYLADQDVFLVSNVSGVVSLLDARTQTLQSPSFAVTSDNIKHFELV
jgi:hypothetical protein